MLQSALYTRFRIDPEACAFQRNDQHKARQWHETDHSETDHLLMTTKDAAASPIAKYGKPLTSAISKTAAE